MSQENVEIVRLIFEAFPRLQESLRRGELPIAEPFSEEIEWDASDLGLPDLGDGRLRGREAVRRFWVAWLSAWEDVSFEYELYEAGDKVVAVVDQRMRGSQVEIPETRYAHVYTFRNGEVVHWKLYMDHTAALEAAGLSEYVMSQENVELVEAAHAAVNRGDLDALLEVVHPEAEFRSLIAESEGRDYRGHAGVREWWEQVVESMGGMHSLVEHTESRGDAAISRIRLRGEVEGVEVTQTAWQATRVRDGAVVWWGFFRTEAEALEAAGLSE